MGEGACAEVRSAALRRGNKRGGGPIFICFTSPEVDTHAGEPAPASCLSICVLVLAFLGGPDSQGALCRLWTQPSGLADGVPH